MPQARSAGSTTHKSAAKATAVKPGAAKSTAAKSTAARSTTAKPAAARSSKSTAAKPAAARSSKSTAAKSTATRRTTAKPTAAKSAAAKPASGRARTSKTSAESRAGAGPKARSTAKPRPRVTIQVNTEGTQLEAIAERLRKLNERIIDAGREAGESTLGSYEKALKTFATGISKGPAKNELEWIQHLAASQAKFVREVTEGLAKVARERLK